jgi:hypothetical protein
MLQGVSNMLTRTEECGAAEHDGGCAISKMARKYLSPRVAFRFNYA